MLESYQMEEIPAAVPCALVPEGRHPIRALVDGMVLKHISTPCDVLEADAVSRLGGPPVCTDYIEYYKGCLGGLRGLRGGSVNRTDNDFLLRTALGRYVPETSVRRNARRDARAGSNDSRLATIDDAFTRRLQRRWPESDLAVSILVDLHTNRAPSYKVDVVIYGDKLSYMRYQFDGHGWNHMSGAIGNEAFTRSLDEFLPPAALRGLNVWLSSAS